MSKFKKDRFQTKGPSQRQLRVGEEIRHALSEIFLRDEIGDPTLFKASVTVSEVRISPDLRNATAYVMPLSGSNKEEVLALLARHAGIIRTLVAKKLPLKFSARIGFKVDHSFETASHIDGLLREAKARSVDVDDQ